MRSESSVLIITNGLAAKSILLDRTLYSRQKPNAWMIKTFLIINPFTVSNNEYRKEFVASIFKMLSELYKPDNYKCFVEIVQRNIDERMILNEAVNLSQTIQIIVLNIFIKSFLNIDASNVLLNELPTLINRLWIKKNDQVSRTQILNLLTQETGNFSGSTAWQKIRRIMQDHKSSMMIELGLSDLDEEIGNALNIVIPGYETMWRVVFYTLLELIRRPILFNELRNSTSVELLIPCVKETLRLYPPTKSIYRQNIQSGQEIRIAIDQIHRDIGVWGLDANTFS
ncbi:unnamed protein product [Didymodactylos carnosus]|uniref:Uncharacterized protein n=1 Tax=Didymodactylos carnosus TaxID=1234261 RepID=A0A816BAU9_9BILA|nr:unnamed protein product [Didymodactylos carnosus]CAF4485789.1 unnamed protein product [Didymodactylos carnosus]